MLPRDDTASDGSAHPHDAERIGQLADATRRALYEYVAGSDDPVSREQAASATDIPPHQAKFHLDRLERAGLLESDYARPEGRTGPGAGRPAKRYRRPNRDVSVSLPPREYDLAGHILAGAITRAGAEGTPIDEAIRNVARERGRTLATTAQTPSTAEEALAEASGILRNHGYEPQQTDGQVVLRNCPFHALAQQHQDLVCTLNHELICGLGDELGPHHPAAHLDPQPGRCCVRLELGEA